MIKKITNVIHVKSPLKGHINSVHNGLKDKKCDSCQKTFSEAGNLKAHIKAVHNEKNLKRFSSDDFELILEKPSQNQCIICKKVMTHSPNLRVHLEKVHNYGLHFYWFLICCQKQ